MPLIWLCSHSAKLNKCSAEVLSSMSGDRGREEAMNAHAREILLADLFIYSRQASQAI